MRLSQLCDDDNPISILLAGRMSPGDLARIRLVAENARPGVVRNNLFSEGLLNNLGRVIALKSKAASLLPSEVKRNEYINGLLNAAGRTNDLVTNPSMSMWWNQLSEVIRRSFGIDNDAILQEIMGAAANKTKVEFDRIHHEYLDDLKDTENDRNDSDELTGKERELKHKKALKDLEAKYGGTSTGDTEKDEAKAKAARQMKTAAKFLGIPDEDAEDMDYDTLKDLLQLAINSKQRGKKDETDDDDNPISGLRKRLKSLRNRMDTAGLDRLMALSNSDAILVLEALGSNPTFMDTVKDMGSGALSRLTGLFSRRRRDQMGNDMMRSTIKKYLAAYAIRTAIDAARDIQARLELAPDVLETDDEGHHEVEVVKDKPKKSKKKPKLNPDEIY